ncbi:MAG TPA: MarR family transcriptional regulator [Methanoregulaceae archaeon]|nr:MarR family transcriptional regulator [Methanoregulaceae archaeon]
MILPRTGEVPSFSAAFSITTRGHAIFLNERLRPLRLSAGQFPVLMLLAQEQNITQETLVRHYRLDKGTIARAVRKLEAAGYIRRIVDLGNRRAVRIFLTESGEAVVPVLKAINSQWEDSVCAGLDGEERGTLEALIRRVAANSLVIMESSDRCSGDDE